MIRTADANPWGALTTVVGEMASPASLADATKAARNPVGTGPFQFVEWVSGDHVTVKKFDKYWGAQGRSRTCTSG